MNGEASAVLIGWGWGGSQDSSHWIGDLWAKSWRRGGGNHVDIWERVLQTAWHVQRSWGRTWLPPSPLWVCPSVTGSTRTITLPDLHWGPCKLWMTASTIAGQGPPGPSLQFHLPGRGLGWDCYVKGPYSTGRGYIILTELHWVDNLLTWGCRWCILMLLNTAVD